MQNGYQAKRQAEIVEAGLRQCKPYVCPRCRAQCLRGDDHDRCALVATVDTAPVDALGEVMAILSGLATFTIEPTRGMNSKPDVFELFHRSWWHYATHDHPILVEHRCRKDTAHVG